MGNGGSQADADLPSLTNSSGITGDASETCWTGAHEIASGDIAPGRLEMMFRTRSTSELTFHRFCTVLRHMGWLLHGNSRMKTTHSRSAHLTCHSHVASSTREGSCAHTNGTRNGVNASIQQTMRE